MSVRHSFDDDTENSFEKESLLQSASTTTPSPRKQVSLRRLLIGGIITALILSTAIGVDIFLRVKWRSQYPFHVEKKFRCGKNAQEAKALGCVFELMTVSWMPMECHDSELNEEFRAVRVWHFYEDSNGTKEISETELSEKTVMSYTTNEFHRMHCGYSWMKMHRALKEGRRIDRGLSYYKHTLHCADMYRPANMSAIGTDVNIGFGAC
ncbi:hypothetical protein F5884DRAFT_760312 [Xylogone sp. PMI_703]|nr:hypothetical protein F5884DRAFT_760312 [Xylogone sp. PMI_703]